jgi:hypothetical protein
MTDRVTYLSAITQYTVYDALYDLAIKLPMLRYEGAVTGVGTGTTITDTYLPPTNGMFDGGTLFVWWTTTGPVVHTKRSKLITDHTGTTLTFDPSDASINAGAGYAAFNASFPHWLLIQSLGLALQDFGDIPIQRSITTVADQAEYDYTDSAAIMTGNQVIGVEIARNKAEPYEYYPHYHWSMIHNATSGMTLVFDPSHIPPGGYNMRLTYLCKHLDIVGRETYASLTWAAQDSLEIAPLINPQRLSWQAAVYALRWKVGASPSEPMYATMLNEAIKRAEMLSAQFPIRLPNKVHQAKWLVGR